MDIKERKRLYTELKNNPVSTYRKEASKAHDENIRDLLIQLADAEEEKKNSDSTISDKEYEEGRARSQVLIRLANEGPSLTERFVWSSNDLLDKLVHIGRKFVQKLSPIVRIYSEIINKGWWFIPIFLFTWINLFALHGFAACFLLAFLPFIVFEAIGIFLQVKKSRHLVSVVSLFFILLGISSFILGFKTTFVSENYRKSSDCGVHDSHGPCDVDDHPMEVLGKGKVLFTWVSHDEDPLFLVKKIPATMFTSNSVDWIKLNHAKEYETEDPIIDASNPNKREIFKTSVSYGLIILPYDKKVSTKTSGGLKSESELIQKQVASILGSLKPSEVDILPDEKVYGEKISQIKNPLFKVVNPKVVRSKIATEFFEEGEWWRVVKKTHLPDKDQKG